MPTTYQDLVDELRCHPNQWLRQERTRVVGEQRRLRVREIAITKVLDERDARDPMPEASVPTSTAKATVEVARALDSTPALADAAVAGKLSWEQLEPLTRIATHETDAEWAQRGPSCTPFDLQKLARRARKLTAEDTAGRSQARELRTWREPEWGMVAGRFRIPELDGILVERVFEHMAEQLRPAPGQPWDSLAHRKADALVDLCTSYVDVEPTGKFRHTIVTHVRDDGTADCDGLEVAPATVDAIAPAATIKTRREDRHGRERSTTRARKALPADVERHVRDRDKRCRVPGCNHTRRLQPHHLVPCCRGGHDGIDNLAMVCPSHHRMLVPHGPWHLIGDPEQIDGLRLVHEDELIDARAGPAP
ncbi:MAG TPA: HNH endonuclease signature motif containing protein [Acidimicrobiia bacterium]